jgi:hypothetical protein
VKAHDVAFVSFEPGDEGFRAFFSVEGLLSTDEEPESLLTRASQLYERCLATMRARVANIEQLRSARKLTPARTIWRLGNDIFELVERMRAMSLQLDDVYGHLTRDLGVKRKWLEKAIIFRRYLPSEALIPEALPWGRCEKGTRRVAMRLRNGLPPK